jgi:hypothetical protein
MRNALDLFVNRVMCKSQPGIKTRHEDIDIVVSMFLALPDPDPSLFVRIRILSIVKQ